MSTGLKDQLGLGEPSAPSSTAQADNFKASFQAAAEPINKALQYTAANTHPSKHDPHASKRDTTQQAYQAALAKIDPKNAGVAQSAIDQVLAAVGGVASTVEPFRAAVEKAYNEWTARQPEADALADKVREMIEWGHGKAGALQQVVEAVVAKANEKLYEEALQALDQVAAKAKAIIEEYEKQRAAQQEFEPQWEALLPRSEALLTFNFKTLQPDLDAIATARSAIEGCVASKDYVSALAQLADLESKVAAAEQKSAELQQERGEYEAQRSGIDPKLAEAKTKPFKALAEIDAEITAATGHVDEAAAAEDYAQSTQLVGELATKVNEKLTRAAEIEAKKTEYETARAQLDPTIQQASTCEFKALADLDPPIVDLTTQVDQAATDEDYERSSQLLCDLATKVEEKVIKSDELTAKRSEYEAARAELEPRLQEASTCEYEALAELDQQIDAATGELDMAAEGQEYDQALLIVTDLTAKVDEKLARVAEIELKRAEWEAARKGAVEKLTECTLVANSYATLKGDQDALKPKLDAADAAAEGQDFDKALQLATELTTACDAYMGKAKTEQEKYTKRAGELNKQLDDADAVNREGVARTLANALTPDELKHLPTETKNRIMQELETGGLSDDDKRALDNIYKVRSLDPEFEKVDRLKREELIDKLKNDPELAKARENWKTMSKDDKLKVMEKVAGIHTGVYGTADMEPKMSVKSYDKPPTKDADGNVTGWNNGIYDFSNGELTINTNPYVASEEPYEGVKFNNFDKSMDLAVHEAGHRYQQYLVKEVTAGNIPKTDPRYQQAISFKVNDGYYTSEPADVYENQPMESHSRESAATIWAAGIGSPDKKEHKHEHAH
ncbi:MAG: hypothetical protein ACRCT8_03795 [Lacipirellulaceae bacterium]